MATPRFVSRTTQRVRQNRLPEELLLATNHWSTLCCFDRDPRQRRPSRQRDMTGGVRSDYSASAASISSTEGFTRARPFTTTVGTVSLPDATPRTNAAASASSQILRFSTLNDVSESRRANAPQKPQPGRQYITTSAGFIPDSDTHKGYLCAVIACGGEAAAQLPAGPAGPAELPRARSP